MWGARLDDVPPHLTCILVPEKKLQEFRALLELLLF